MELRGLDNPMIEKTPKLIIVGGQSGSGKTTTCNFIASHFPNITYYRNQGTSRKPRPCEEGKGAHKLFSLERFHQLESEGKILMKTKFAGNYYWYTYDFIDDINNSFKEKQSLVVDSIQPIKNWEKFKEKFPEIPVVTIFLFSTNLEVLKARIMNRTNSSLEDTNIRLEDSKNILSESELYDFRIDTTDFYNFKEKIISIIKNIIFEV